MKALEKKIVNEAVEDMDIHCDVLRTTSTKLAECFTIILRENEALAEENEALSGIALHENWNVLITDTVSEMEECFQEMDDTIHTVSLTGQDLHTQLVPPMPAKFGPRTEKLCSCCGKIKRREDFAYSAQHADERQKYCHTCQTRVAANNKKKVEAKPRIQCRVCGVEKLTSSFPKVRNTGKPFHTCKACCRKGGLV